VRGLETSVSEYTLRQSHVPREANPQLHTSVRAPYNTIYCFLKYFTL